MKKCVMCEKEIFGLKIKYCSRTCERKSYKIRNREKVRLYSRLYRARRQAVLKETAAVRRAYKKLLEDASCLRCGAKEGLHVHHIRPVLSGGNNHIANLTTLCNECHARWHAMFDDNYWLLMPELPLAYYESNARQSRAVREVRKIAAKRQQRPKVKKNPDIVMRPTNPDGTIVL